jgi:chitin disaccharide deacetylase
LGGDQRKTLYVNADDFGFTADVNEGIVHGHRQGIVTATTLMANGVAFADAVTRAKQTPTLDVGCHLVLVGGDSLVSKKPLPRSLSGMMSAVVLGGLEPYHEFRAQIKKILAAGIRPVHMDTHKHTHLFPPVLDAVAKLGEEFGIPWVRRPFDFPLDGRRVPLPRQALSRSLHALRLRFHSTLEKRGCRTTDNFAGFSLTGHLQITDLVYLLDHLPPGSTELMVHPGYCREALRSAATRLKESRERELLALTAAATRQAIERNGITLGRYAAR